MLPPEHVSVTMSGFRDGGDTEIIISTSMITRPVETESHCDAGAFTDSYGIFVQTVLAGLAFTSLIVKRFCEPKFERRPWSIWFFDTSKQATGAAFIHMLNVFLAPMFQGDPCTWYVVSFLLDSTLGLLVIYVGVKTTSFIARLKNYPTLKFGEYGPPNKPPQCRPWLHQCLAFFVIILFEKIFITLLLQMKFWFNVRRLILWPVKINPKFELTMVMLVIPFFVNLLIFWCVDNFTMKHKSLFNVNGDSKEDLKKRQKKLEIDERESRQKLLTNDEGDGFTEIFINDDRLKQRLNSSSSS